LPALANPDPDIKNQAFLHTIGVYLRTDPHLHPFLLNEIKALPFEKFPTPRTISNTEDIRYLIDL